MQVTLLTDLINADLQGTTAARLLTVSPATSPTDAQPAILATGWQTPLNVRRFAETVFGSKEPRDVMTEIQYLETAAAQPALYNLAIFVEEATCQPAVVLPAATTAPLAILPRTAHHAKLHISYSPTLLETSAKLTAAQFCSALPATFPTLRLSSAMAVLWDIQWEEATIAWLFAETGMCWELRSAMTEISLLEMAVRLLVQSRTLLLVQSWSTPASALSARDPLSKRPTKLYANPVPTTAAPAMLRVTAPPATLLQTECSTPTAADASLPPASTRTEPATWLLPATLPVRPAPTAQAQTVRPAAALGSSTVRNVLHVLWWPEQDACLVLEVGLLLYVRPVPEVLYQVVAAFLLHRICRNLLTWWSLSWRLWEDCCCVPVVWFCFVAGEDAETRKIRWKMNKYLKKKKEKKNKNKTIRNKSILLTRNCCKLTRKNTEEGR